MKKIDVIRAWRDEEYRNSLSPEERASLPENPAGVAMVQDSVLASITGGCGTPTTFVSSCVHYPEQCP
jgi:mersacidin/lichenicidin family type 2 lantibiotic